MTTNETAYTTFEALEERLAHCYFLLHEQFLGDPEFARLWAEAALDELQHASILRFCREHGLAAGIDIQPAVAERIQGLLDAVSTIVRNPDVTPG